MRILLVSIHFFLYFCRPLLTNAFPKMDTKSFIQTKKPYAKPIMLAERFVANEFVAACSVQGAPLGGGGYYLYDSGTNTGWVDNNDEKHGSSGWPGDLISFIENGQYEVLSTEPMIKNGAQGYILINNSISPYGNNGSYDFDYYNLSNTQYWAPGVIAHVKIVRDKDYTAYLDLFFSGSSSSGNTNYNGS